MSGRKSQDSGLGKSSFPILRLYEGFRAFPVGSDALKNPLAMQETWVRSLGQDDPLEKEMATHSSNSCLENPMDRGAWWATVHEAAKSWTWLSDLTSLLEKVNHMSPGWWTCTAHISTCIRQSWLVDGPEVGHSGKEKCWGKLGR